MSVPPATLWARLRPFGRGVQIKVLRQTATVHADQARRQIGQLQADLAGRPHPGQPRPPADVQTACAQSASAQAASAQLRPRRRAGVDQKFLHQDDGFAHTAIVGAEGFAPTQLLR